MKKEGFRITYLPVDKDGIVDIEALKDALDDETILVSVMYVNNEIGAVEPIEEIGHIIKDYNPDIVYHVDAIQAYGKYKIYPKKLESICYQSVDIRSSRTQGKRILIH